MRKCFTALLDKFCLNFVKKNKNPLLFTLSGSSGLGKSSFGIILFLFIANAVVVSNLENSNIDKNKYKDFFPPLDLNLKSSQKKGFAILYFNKSDKFIAVYRKDTKCWTYVEGLNEYDLNSHFQMFSNYNCFFIIDPVFENLNIKSATFGFDGVVILIGSPKLIYSSRQMYTNKFISKYCYYYPLWEDEEFEIFTNYFGLSNKFDLKEIGVLKSEMGLEKLSKTEVFGNNPRKIISKGEAVDLADLLNAVKSQELEKYLRESGNSNDLLNKSATDVIHRIFFIRPSDDLIYCSPVFISVYVQCLLTRYVSYLKTANALNNYKKYHELQNSALSGINYETYFHVYINELQNRIIEIKRKFNNNTLEFTPFKKTFCFNVDLYKRTNDIDASSLNNCFYCPIKFNYATFDSVYSGNVKQYIGNNTTFTTKSVVCFFQCTVGNSHPFSKENYHIMENCLNLDDNVEVCLIFIVPNCSISFKPAINDIDPKINVYMATFSL
jgi:hypothetical protein